MCAARRSAALALAQLHCRVQRQHTVSLSAMETAAAAAGVLAAAAIANTTLPSHACSSALEMRRQREERQPVPDICELMLILTALQNCLDLCHQTLASLQAR